MAIIAENCYGWFICSKTYFDLLYSIHKSEDARLPSLHKIRRDFFQINTPFLMNSESQKLAYNKCKFETFLQKKLLKSKKKSSNKQDMNEEIEDFIKKGVNSLILAVKVLKYLDDSEESSQDWLENNSKAREAALEVLSYQNKLFQSHLQFESTSSYPMIKDFSDDLYLIPPFSSFEICDISNYFLAESKKYDLVLIDPPWINRSVKRKKSYAQLKYDCLQNLKVEKITNPGCLIAVWVTNSPSSSAFVLNKLFPKCNIICSAMWYWCKITRKGKFIFPLKSHHKKPYEKIILGRVSYENSSNRPVIEIGPEKLIVSVPSSIHSNKPPLVEVLKPFLIDDAKCLELFGRYLLPKWKTVGNEALKLQNIKLFEVENAEH